MIIGNNNRDKKIVEILDYIFNLDEIYTKKYNRMFGDNFDKKFGCIFVTVSYFLDNYGENADFRNFPWPKEILQMGEIMYK